MEIVYQSDDESVQVCFDAVEALLMIEFNGVVRHETYQEAYAEFLRLAKVHACKKLIYHTQKLKKVSVKSRIWYLKQIAPYLMDSDLRSAIVNAEQIGNQVATETMREVLIEMGYQAHAVKRFDTFEEALSWLHNSSATS